jgi:thiol:disulfide interchange protein DsbD
VLVTFLALGATLIALRTAGEAAGWGFQLQSPIFMGALALLFFVIGLNLIGAFDIGSSVSNVGSGLAARGGEAGAFFTGLLAVVAATPCTAPFMAGALGFAATQPAPVALGVFAALGLGFATPFAALSFAPGLQRILPKPGPWMERARQFFAFPMFGAAVWAAWVTTAQAGSGGALVLLSAATTVAFVIWALRAFKSRVWAVGLAAAAIAVAAGVALMTRPLPFTIEPWSPERVAELRADGRAVFVNFTADWCVTCQVNERTSLSSQRIAAAFAAGEVVYLKADWTNRDATIAAALAEHGRDGVPLYLFYPAGEPGAAPIVLPQVLTEGTVLQAVAGP